MLWQQVADGQWCLGVHAACVEIKSIYVMCLVTCGVMLSVRIDMVSWCKGIGFICDNIGSCVI